MENTSSRLSSLLFSGAGEGVFAVLDGASVPALRMKLYELQPEHVCLFPGELTPDMEEVAPYLIRIEQGSEFARWVIERGWGRHWGIYAACPVRLANLRRHFRGFLTVHDPDGRPMRFRYYDPRVLRVYLPSCDSAQLETMFGPVSKFVAEDGDTETALVFRLRSGRLEVEKTLLKAGAEIEKRG